jgi:peptidoglycan/LPS O-acetylase OafA/YrhL
MSDEASILKNYTPHFPAIDGLRGVAAAAVFLLHMNALFKNGFSIYLAHLSVDFFFLLSGFVVSHAYDARLSGGWNFGQFAWVRVVRLYPMIIIGSILGCVVLAARVILYRDLTVLNGFEAAIMNFFMLPTGVMLNVRPWGFPLNSPFWSLSVEFIVNFVYCLTFRYLSTAVMAWVVLFGVGVSVWAVSVRGTLDVGPMYAEFALGLARAVYPFAMGVLIRRLGLGLPGHSSGFLPVALVLGGALLLPIAADWRIELGMTLVLFPAVMILSRNMRSRGGVQWVSRWIGRLSYPLYATHYPIIVMFAQCVRMLHLSGRPAQIWELICGLTVVGVAAALAIWVEPPAAAMLRRVTEHLFPSQRPASREPA